MHVSFQFTKPDPSLIHSTEKSLEEHSDKVDPTTVEAIELAIAALKDELEFEDSGQEAAFVSLWKMVDLRVKVQSQHKHSV